MEKLVNRKGLKKSGGLSPKWILAQVGRESLWARVHLEIFNNEKQKVRRESILGESPPLQSLMTNQ